MSKLEDLIRALNDRLRCQHNGGTIVVTKGVQAMGADFIAIVDKALTKVTFDIENDPYHEHDFGTDQIRGRSVFFEIDYYDLSCHFALPDTAVETRTHRVMTILLSEEY